MWQIIVGVSVALTAVIIQAQYSEWKRSWSDDSSPSAKAFQFNYLLVYLLANGADWLQGPYVYALYESYGHDKDTIAILFVGGFVSSMFFGTLVGSLADIYGRKRMTIAFGLIYAFSCLTKLFKNFWILLLGRFTSGVATSLLFSVLEAWMVSEHHRLGFDQNFLTSIFSKSATLNAVAAIVAGLIASLSAAVFGFIAPFLMALIILLFVTAVVHLHWVENYGDAHLEVSENLKTAFRAIRSNTSILLLGIVQSLFEGAMYVFVFLWTPTLSESSADFKHGGQNYLHGLVFSSFMLAIMYGSTIFSKLSEWMHPSKIMMRTLLLAAGALAVPIFVSNASLQLLAFIAFEFSCGLYFPAAASIRSIIIPEDSRSTIMNLYRMGLNLLVIVALNTTSSLTPATTFSICTGWLVIAAALMMFFPEISTKADPPV
jgi:MFS family permease